MVRCLQPSRFLSIQDKTNLAHVAVVAAREHDVDTVVLTGGCFLNTILTDRLTRLLARLGVRRVLKHQRLSPGDASLSLGQAYAVASMQRRNN